MSLVLQAVDTGLILAQVPNPGAGTPPPGSEKLLQLLRYGAWIAFAVCVGGVLLSAAKMASDHQHGRGGGEGAQRLVWTLVASIVGASASALVGAFV